MLPRIQVNKNNLSLSNSRLEANFDLEQWNKETFVGLTGAFLCSKVFGKNNGGRITIKASY